MDAARSAEDERLDALRRRLYAPDATESDVAAYRAAGPASMGAEAEDLEPQPPRGRRPVPLRVRALVTSGAVLLVAAGVAVLLVTRPLAPIDGAVGSPTADATRSASPIGQQRVPVAATARQGFVRSLRSGDRSGLLDYLYRHPADLPAQLRTTSRADSIEYSGQGPSTILVHPTDLAQRGGRMTVILVLDRPATFSWVAEGAVTATTRAGAGQIGEPVSSTVAYRGRAPTRLAVHLDETVRWGAVVVFTD